MHHYRTEAKNTRSPATRERCWEHAKRSSACAVLLGVRSRNIKRGKEPPRPLHTSQRTPQRQPITKKKKKKTRQRGHNSLLKAQAAERERQRERFIPERTHEGECVHTKHLWCPCRGRRRRPVTLSWKPTRQQDNKPTITRPPRPRTRTSYVYP